MSVAIDLAERLRQTEQWLAIAVAEIERLTWNAPTPQIVHDMRAFLKETQADAR